MSTHRTCCCGCGDKPCTGEEYFYDDTSGSCPICAIGRVTSLTNDWWKQHDNGRICESCLSNAVRMDPEPIPEIAPIYNQDDFILGPHPSNLYVGDICLEVRSRWYEEESCPVLSPNVVERHGAGVESSCSGPFGECHDPLEVTNQSGSDHNNCYPNMGARHADQLRWHPFCQPIPDIAFAGWDQLWYSNCEYWHYDYPSDCDRDECQAFYPGVMYHGVSPDGYSFTDDMPPGILMYQFAPPWGFLPWSPQVMKDWKENWGGPLEPRGNCTMNCTQDNIGCHGLAFVGGLGSHWGSHSHQPGREVTQTLPYCGSDVVTIPPIRGENDEGWLWVRDWVRSGGKLVIMAESELAQAGPGCRYQLGYRNGNEGVENNHPNSGMGKRTKYSCMYDDWAEWAEDGSVYYYGPEIEQQLREFAFFCGDDGEQDPEFYTVCHADELPVKKCLEPEEGLIEPAINLIEYDESGEFPKMCCQRTIGGEFKKEGKSFGAMSSNASGLVPKNGAKRLLGSCDTPACTAIYKKNGAGAVIVVYDSNIFGGHTSQIPIGWYEMAAQHPDNIENLSPEELKLKDCNNDFWKFMCEEFLNDEELPEGVSPPTCEESEPIFWEEYDKPYQGNQCLAEVKDAACVLPDGGCIETDIWECFNEKGMWFGSKEFHTKAFSCHSHQVSENYEDGEAPDCPGPCCNFYFFGGVHYEDAGPGEQKFAEGKCNPTCDQLSFTPQPLRKGPCCKPVYELTEQFCSDDEPKLQFRGYEPLACDVYEYECRCIQWQYAKENYPNAYEEYPGEANINFPNGTNGPVKVYLEYPEWRPVEDCEDCVMMEEEEEPECCSHEECGTDECTWCEFGKCVTYGGPWPNCDKPGWECGFAEAPDPTCGNVPGGNDGGDTGLCCLDGWCQPCGTECESTDDCCENFNPEFPGDECRYCCIDNNCQRCPDPGQDDCAEDCPSGYSCCDCQDEWTLGCGGDDNGLWCDSDGDYGSPGCAVCYLGAAEGWDPEVPGSGTCANGSTYVDPEGCCGACGPPSQSCCWGQDTCDEEECATPGICNLSQGLCCVNTWPDCGEPNCNSVCKPCPCSGNSECPQDYCCNQQTGECEECEPPDNCCALAEQECLDNGGSAEECNCEQCLTNPDCSLCDCYYQQSAEGGSWVCSSS